MNLYLGKKLTVGAVAAGLCLGGVTLGATGCASSSQQTKTDTAAAAPAAEEAEAAPAAEEAEAAPAAEEAEAAPAEGGEAAPAEGGEKSCGG